MKRETKESYARSLTSYNKLFYWYFLVLLSVAVGTLFFINKTFAEEIDTQVETEKEIEKVEEPTEVNLLKGKNSNFKHEIVYIKPIKNDEDFIEEVNNESVEVIEADSTEINMDLVIKDEVLSNNNKDLSKNVNNLSNNKKNSENLSIPIEKNSEIVYNYNSVGNSVEVPKNDNKVIIDTTETEVIVPTDKNKDFVGILVNYDVDEEYITIDILETIEINSYEGFVNLIDSVCSSLNINYYENADKSYYVLGNNGIYYLLRYSLASSISTSSSSVKTEDVLLEIFSVSEEDIQNLGLNSNNNALDLTPEALLEFEDYKNNNFTKTQTIEVLGKYKGYSQNFRLDNYTLSDFDKDEIIRIFGNLNNGQTDNLNIKFNQNKIELGEDVKIEITVN